MSARAIVSGSLYRPAEARTSKNGRAYATAKIREGVGETTRWWNVVAFSESAVEALLSLQDGEPVAVGGEIDGELYTTSSGDTRLSWKITVDCVLTARKPPKAKPDKTAPIGRAEGSTEREVAPFDDAISF